MIVWLVFFMIYAMLSAFCDRKYLFWFKDINGSIQYVCPLLILQASWYKTQNNSNITHTQKAFVATNWKLICPFRLSWLLPFVAWNQPFLWAEFSLFWKLIIFEVIIFRVIISWEKGATGTVAAFCQGLNLIIFGTSDFWNSLFFESLSP
jgi:hypothetical protein